MLKKVCNTKQDPNVEEGIQYKAGGQPIEKEEVDVKEEDTDDEDGMKRCMFNV